MWSEISRKAREHCNHSGQVEMGETSAFYYQVVKDENSEGLSSIKDNRAYAARIKSKAWLLRVVKTSRQIEGTPCERFRLRESVCISTIKCIF